MKFKIYVHNDINLSNKDIEKVNMLFAKYFTCVAKYVKPVKNTEDLVNFCLSAPNAKDVVILNLDKNLGKHSSIHTRKDSVTGKKVTIADVNMSRTVDINGNYVDHFLDIPYTRLGIVGRHTNRHFIIYDSDIVVGYGVELLKKKILQIEPDATIEVKSPLFLKKDEEFVDLSDLTTKGVRLHGTTDHRIPYLQNEFFLEKYVSIPKKHYFEFKESFDRIVNPAKYEMEKRIDAMHEWAKKEDRKTFVIGVSGGVDSAVCLGLLSKMKLFN